MAGSFLLKEYQIQTLQVLRRFLEKTVELNDADTAFYSITKRSFTPAPSFPGLPYVCLRIPTGGGKTILAAHSVGVASDTFLRSDNPTVLWLVPSQTIRDQTLKSLKLRSHPNRRALSDRFGENVEIMSVDDALYSRRADYDGGATVIVATLQAFRVEDTEGRKVYETNGELMDHFAALSQLQKSHLDVGPGGEPVPSLANVLRMRRPMVIVDEAHNARTELSFDTLARLRPSLILEFTATPVTAEEHNPQKGLFASNVLHHVSAAELKAANMIKLPVVLRGRPDPKETIGDAIAWLDELAVKANLEAEETGEFIRPMMLVQAAPKSKGKATLHADEVKKLLVDDFRVPDTHIAIATGETRELENINLFDPECSIRFVITQSALREGWDCSFAYVLCSVAEQKSSRAVEQILGRVLRLPGAKRKRNEELNRAYAFATTTSFQNAANSLRDGLINNGFEKIEALNVIKTPQLDGFEAGGEAYVYEQSLPASVDASNFKVAVEAAVAGRIEVDVIKGVLRARGALTDYDQNALLLVVPSEVAETIQTLVHKSRGVRLGLREDAKLEPVFAVPRLSVRRNGVLELFDRAHFLDIPWKLEECDPTLILDAFQSPTNRAEEARVDVSATGQVTVEFVSDLHQQLSLALEQRGWTKPALVNWLDRRLPYSSRRDITRLSSTLFISKALEVIGSHHSIGVDGLARAKFRMVEALVATIGRLRLEREASAFTSALFPQSGIEFETSADLALVFSEDRYSYGEPYRGGTTFKKHLFPIIGDMKSAGEEFECAVHIERSPVVERWVRNTSRQPNSFWLQTSSDKFYPDFVALLNDGRILVVEYKGEPYASNDDSKEKRLVGELWSERSNGSCIFLMVEDRRFAQIDAALADARG